MHKSTFDEKQLENLLQSLPKVKDHQDPEQLFAKISSRLDEEMVKEKKATPRRAPRTKRTWILPSLASIAAVVIVAVVAPSFLNEQESLKENMASQSMEQKAIESETQDNVENFTMMAEEAPLARIANDQAILVIPDLNGNRGEQEIITVAVPDANAQFVVPISIRVPKEEGKTKLEQLETIADNLHEGQLGLSSYILSEVAFAEETMKNGVNKLIIDVPANHVFGNGSAMETIFMATVKEMAKQLDYQIVQFKTAGKLGITLGNYGELTEIDLRNEVPRRVYYVFQPNGQMQKFLLPIANEGTFNQAIEAMKAPIEMDGGEIQPSIPTAVLFKQITIDEKSNRAIVEFANETNIVNDEIHIIMIEAILMTAKEYGAQEVEFRNPTALQVGPYQLTEPVLVPLAVNPIPY